jgi:TonB family protein
MGDVIEKPEQPGVHEEGGSLPRFEVERPRRQRLFWSNLHDFLYERPVKGTPRDSYLHPVDYGSQFSDNLKDFFGPRVRPVADSTMLVEEKPWYKAFVENVREGFHLLGQRPVKLDQPIEVGELWNPPRQYRRVQLFVFLGHVLVALLILVPLFPRITQPPVQATANLVPLDFSPYEPLFRAKPGKALHGGGGGGERNPVPATRGRLPRFSMTQFSPPMAKIIPHPAIPVEATVLGPPHIKIPSPNLPNYGDPLAKLITPSGGPGDGGGIGTGSSSGVGSGSGGGVGPGYEYGTGGGYPQAGEGGYGSPVCVYCPRPEFSDAAVKLKYQGSVWLRVLVSATGHVDRMEVLRSLGLGLDQKAEQTVRTWVLKPAIGPNGKPAAVWVQVEIDFRLY